MHDIESAWALLDHSENDRQLALMAELRRLVRHFPLHLRPH